MNRPCEYKKYVDGLWEKFIGKFLAWGIDYEELDGGPGTFTAAIIEDNDGNVHLVAANLVKFLDAGGK